MIVDVAPSPYMSVKGALPRKLPGFFWPIPRFGYCQKANFKHFLTRVQLDVAPQSSPAAVSWSRDCPH